MREDYQLICNMLCETLKCTLNAGHPANNPLDRMVYLENEGLVRPIFKDGTGESGCYDVNVAGDSGTAMIEDIVRQFVSRMW